MNNTNEEEKLMEEIIGMDTTIVLNSSEEPEDPYLEVARENVEKVEDKNKEND